MTLTRPFTTPHCPNPHTKNVISHLLPSLASLGFDNSTQRLPRIRNLASCYLFFRDFPPAEVKLKVIPIWAQVLAWPRPWSFAEEVSPPSRTSPGTCRRRPTVSMSRGVCPPRRWSWRQKSSPEIVLIIDQGGITQCWEISLNSIEPENSS